MYEKRHVHTALASPPAITAYRDHSNGDLFKFDRVPPLALTHTSMLALRRALNNPGRCQDVVSHRLVFCENALSLPMKDLLLECSHCQRFLAYCCSCTGQQRESARRQRRFRSARDNNNDDDDDDSPPLKLCHYYKVALVDGACLGNGQEGATAGIGIAIGTDPTTMHWAIPIDDDVDPCSLRTSQRAELLAALYGICTLAESRSPFDRAREVHGDSDGKITWVITSDSEYVVLGMTEWVPAWKANAWHNASGRRPKNLDLFQRLDAAVERHEREYGVRIAFWRISRVYNELADELARFAAKGHTVEPVPLESTDSSDDEMSLD